jgi:hypothetical protein
LLKEFHRLSSSDSGTNKLAERPHQFRDRKVTKNQSILVPRVSSERREYVPIGFIGPEYIATDSSQVIYDAEPYLFGVISSRMHMSWLRAVGGKLEDRLRYSKNIVYNNFPFPDITDDQKKTITNQVYNILDERERYPEKTMAELYDPEKMPESLRDAHQYLDEVIDKIYRSKSFKDDNERLEHLFTLYEEMVKKEK